MAGLRESSADGTGANKENQQSPSSPSSLAFSREAPSFRGMSNGDVSCKMKASCHIVRSSSEIQSMIDVKKKKKKRKRKKHSKHVATRDPLPLHPPPTTTTMSTRPLPPLPPHHHDYPPDPYLFASPYHVPHHYPQYPHPYEEPATSSFPVGTILHKGFYDLLSMIPTPSPSGFLAAWRASPPSNTESVAGPRYEELDTTPIKPMPKKGRKVTKDMVSKPTGFV